MRAAAERTLVVAITFATLSVAFSASADETTEDTRPIATSCTPPIKCCRICTNGKACGNTCIAATKSCSKGKGCACDVADVCAEDP